MSEVGTPWWRAPELSTHLYDFSADIFSFGIVLYEIILRAHGEDIRVEMTFEKVCFSNQSICPRPLITSLLCAENSWTKVSVWGSTTNVSRSQE
jgi:serine/threonine protein kinase